MATLTQIDEQAMQALTESLNASLGEGKWSQRTEQDANGTKLIVSTREQPPREWSTRISASGTPEQQRAVLQAFASQVQAGASQPAGVQLPPDVQATGGQQAPRPAEDTQAEQQPAPAPTVDASTTLGQQAAVGGDEQAAPSSAAESRADAGVADADAASSTTATEESARRRR